MAAGASDLDGRAVGYVDEIGRTVLFRRYHGKLWKLDFQLRRVTGVGRSSAPISWNWGQHGLWEMGEILPQPQGTGVEYQPSLMFRSGSVNVNVNVDEINRGGSKWLSSSVGTVREERALISPIHP